MFPTRFELLAQFKNPVYVQHSHFQIGVRTFSCISKWKDRLVLELPRIRVEILSIDYLEYGGDAPQGATPLTLKFQQDCFRLWYQVDGHGILQNVTRNTFGTARPGLLGIMERGERHAYLHQKGNFECFQVLFSLLPSPSAKCYWNSEVEGKTVLDGNDGRYFENLIFDLFNVLSNNKEYLGLATTSRLMEILVVLFNKGLLVIEESQFPKNKAKSLIVKAKSFMKLHYCDLAHQSMLEKECGVDINYLNVIFKKETGTTLYSYLTGLRMEHAKFLLEATGDPVSEIASRTGYPNSNSFTRAFKRTQHKTPQDFRRSALPKP